MNRSMRLTFSRFSAPTGKALAVAVAALLAAVRLRRPVPPRSSSGCSRRWRFGAPAAALQINPQEFEAPAYCPELRLLVAETYATFERDHDGDAKYVRYLGSITASARECTAVSDAP